jgi:uncharacterized protein YggT (Ycf19 family)
VVPTPFKIAALNGAYIDIHIFAAQDGTEGETTVMALALRLVSRIVNPLRSRIGPTGQVPLPVVVAVLIISSVKRNLRV